MANSNEITRYKQQLMSLIIGNEKIEIGRAHV